MQSNPSDVKLGHSIDDLTRLGLGGRTFLYSEIAAGRLIARKARRKTIVLEDDLRRYLESLPKIGAAAAE